MGARQSDSQYQFTLWSADIDLLQTWVPKVLDAVKKVPGIVDVNTDREQGGLQVKVSIDRASIARLLASPASAREPNSTTWSTSATIAASAVTSLSRRKRDSPAEWKSATTR